VDRDELYDLVFEGELGSAQLSDLIDALERRAAGLEQARRRGDVTAGQAAELDEVAEQLGVLREEVLVAEFIERGLAASLRREQILAALAEQLGGEAE
jgi:hypothetical protein